MIKIDFKLLHCANFLQQSFNNVVLFNEKKTRKSNNVITVLYALICHNQFKNSQFGQITQLQVINIEE